MFTEHVLPARLPPCSGNKGAPKTSSLPARAELTFLGRKIESKNSNVTGAAEEKGERKEWVVIWPRKLGRASWEDDISAETWNPVCQMGGAEASEGWLCRPREQTAAPKAARLPPKAQPCS